MFSRKVKELESLVKASRTRLGEAESRIKNRNVIIGDLQKENAILVQECSDQRKLINRIYDLANMNKYNNEEAFFNKIKELVDDYQISN